MADQNTANDPVFEEEQEHLSAVYAQLVAIRDELETKIEVSHKEAAKDLITMSEEVSQDFVGADETIETLAAIETLNAVIDAYNQTHDFDVERLGRVHLLLRQPYFAKVQLKMRPGRPPRDVYIGAVGITDARRNPLIVDWRNPVAETYYNQEMGPTSYMVDGRVRNVELLLRRQFDLFQDKLNMYFDTTVAIEDSLLLGALKSHHSEKLQAITATIQREQNAVVRHEDVPALLVNGIAGSGKTSVLLQRIAYLLYHERKTLDPSQVYLFTPNSVFERYIDTVLPSLGEKNPQIFTWREWVDQIGQANRGMGEETAPEMFAELERGVEGLTLEISDLHDIKQGDTTLIKASQIKNAVEKFPRTPVGPRLTALVKEELHERLDRKLAQMSKDEEVQDELLALDVDDQLRIFGEMIDPDPADQASVVAYTKRYVEHLYADAHEKIESADWIRIDHIGTRMLGKSNLNAIEWLYLHLLITGGRARNARFVMVDEVQDYTEAQLMLLSRYFAGAHFLLLGDEHQAIKEGTASFEQIRSIFAKSHGSVDECRLLTSYRSSPEITSLFCGLLDEDERVTLSSVQREGVAPKIVACPADADGYLDELRTHVDAAAKEEGLTAIVCADRSRVSWLSKRLGDGVQTMRKSGNGAEGIAGVTLPAEGVVLLDLALAKGLEFDQVIVPDAQAEVYPDTPLARRRLYTALSRAMHKVTVLSQGSLTPLLAANQTV